MTKLTELMTKIKILDLEKSLLEDQLPKAVLEENYVVMSFEETKHLLESRPRAKDESLWRIGKVGDSIPHHSSLVNGFGVGLWFSDFRIDSLELLGNQEDAKFYVARWQLKR
jgi:hypothetical protein